MTVRKLFLVALSLALMISVLPQAPAWAGDGVPATRAEEEEYARLQEQSKGVERFVGGDALGIVIAVIVIVAIVVLVWYLIEHSHGHARLVPKDAYPRPPGDAVPRPA